jgi:dolichyl-phosphate beta-glucosyltransferase
MENKVRIVPRLLSVIIPAYNEEQIIVSTLQKVRAFLSKKDYAYEIIVVDDGSNDRTKDVARRWFEEHSNGRLLQLDRNYGKGRAVRTGMLAAHGDYRLFMDADYSTCIEEIDKCWEKFSACCEVVIGSRALKSSRIARRQTALRYIAGKVFRTLRRVLVLRGVKDTQCGFKCFRGEVAENIFKRVYSDGFIFDVEILFIARLLNYRIAEIPVVWTNDPNSKLNTFRDSVKMLRGLFEIRQRYLKGMYRDNR